MRLGRFHGRMNGSKIASYAVLKKDEIPCLIPRWKGGRLVPKINPEVNL